MIKKISLGFFLATLVFFILSTLCFALPSLQTSTLSRLTNTLGLVSSFGLIMTILLTSLRNSETNPAIYENGRTKVSNIRPA